MLDFCVFCILFNSQGNENNVHDRSQLPSVVSILLFEQRERSIAMHLERAGVGAVEEAEPLLSVAEAITILQRHERARQAKNKALHFRAIATSKVRDRERIATNATMQK